MKAFGVAHGQPPDAQSGGVFRVTLDFSDDDAKELGELGSLLEVARHFVEPGGRLDVALEAHRAAIRVHERAASGVPGKMTGASQ